MSRCLGLVFLAVLLTACWEETVLGTTEVGLAELDGPAAWFPLSDPDVPGHDRSSHHYDGLPIIFTVGPDAVRGDVAHFNGGALLMRPVVQRDFTVSLWLKTDQVGPDQRGWTSGPRIIDADIPGTSAIDFGLSLALDKLAFGVGNPGDVAMDGTAIKSQRKVDDGAWHHVGLTRDGGTGMDQMFLDGVLENSRVGATGDLSLPETVNLGDLGRTSPVAPPLKADLSDVRFYDRVLSPAAIALLATP